MINSPYTRWTGDDLHGRVPVLTLVWVRLDGIYARDPGAPHHVIADGLDMNGVVPGRLWGWFPTVKGDWLGVVNFDIPYADGRPETLHIPEQLVPDYALRRREDTDDRPTWNAQE